MNNLQMWRVPLIIALLPVILLAAMVLFLAGLIVLLRTIHPVVADFITVISSLVIAFFVVTTTLPTFAKTCSYQSPQSSALSISLAKCKRGLSFLYAFVVAVMGLLYRFTMSCCSVHQCIPATYDISENRFWKWIQGWLQSIMSSIMSPNPNLEQEAAEATATGLDAASPLTAYSVTLDHTYLSIAKTCLAHCKGHSALPLRWLAVLLANPPHHGIPARRPPDVQDQLYALVDCAVRHALAYAPAPRLRREMERCAKLIRSSVSGAGWIYDEYYKVPSGLLGPFAVMAMGHATNLAAANDVWWDLYEELGVRQFIVPERDILHTGQSHTFNTLIQHLLTISSFSGDAVAVAAVQRLDAMSRDPDWLSQLADRAGAGIVRWNIRQLRTHFHVVWAMTYPRRPLTPQTPPLPQVHMSSTTVPLPTDGLAPTPHGVHLTVETSPRQGTSMDLAGPHVPDTQDPTVMSCLPIFLCALDIIRKLIDNLPWERSGTRNVPVESEELHQFLQIVQEVSTCDNPTISAAIDTQFIRSTQDAFSKMVREEHWRTLTSPLPDILGCQDILTKLDARISSGGLV